MTFFSVCGYVKSAHLNPEHSLISVPWYAGVTVSRTPYIICGFASSSLVHQALRHTDQSPTGSNLAALHSSDKAHGHSCWYVFQLSNQRCIGRGRPVVANHFQPCFVVDDCAVNKHSWCISRWIDNECFPFKQWILKAQPRFETWHASWFTVLGGSCTTSYRVAFQFPSCVFRTLTYPWDWWIYVITRSAGDCERGWKTLRFPTEISALYILSSHPYFRWTIIIMNIMQ